MMTMYTMDMENPESDPLSRGMLPETTFRISGFDPSVTTRTIVQCLSDLLGSNGERVNFELLWVDETTFLIATKGPGEGRSDDALVLHEHGQLIFERLRNRFSNETIISLDEHLKSLEQVNESNDGGDGSWKSHIYAFVQRTLFNARDKGSGNNKRQSNVDYDRVDKPSKRRRIF